MKQLQSKHNMFLNQESSSDNYEYQQIFSQSYSKTKSQMLKPIKQLFTPTVNQLKKHATKDKKSLMILSQIMTHSETFDDESISSSTTCISEQILKIEQNPKCKDDSTDFMF
ncbi:hypothetical protein SS50377_26207 [Spironucleus salmonicida]|uniref:Uncharacterized protein n=1 Tax=Spironucleus salmonicida TaxID=348837 RepID=V6LEB2_9EUKA|nr:hypothetical protein SS50377_26207 [Spironucleus salmonicida]|eukprot:EST42845.1 Hypothetical protein SS50377_17531 [Spironucleus salmonicida]